MREKQTWSWTSAPTVRDFRDEVRDWLAEHLVGEFAEHRGVGGPTDGEAWEVRLAWDRELSAGGWLGVGWPRGVRRTRARPARGDRLRVRVRPRERPVPGHRQRPRPARPDAARDGQRGAEEALPAADPRRRGTVGPGLQRAGRRLRPRVGAHPRGARRRRVGGQRPEGLDLLRHPRRLALRAGPHRPGVARGTRA